jgi:predicted DNA-binding ribbon-helix-helix protein
MPGLVKRSFSLAGHRTSVALEAAFWAALDKIAAAQGMSAASLVAAIDAARAPGESLASCLRLRALHEANGRNLPPG